MANSYQNMRYKNIWDIQFFSGITSGLNEAFYMDQTTNEYKLLNLDKNNNEIIKPLLRGKDIKRYTYQFEDIYMLFIPWQFPLM